MYLRREFKQKGLKLSVPICVISSYIFTYFVFYIILSMSEIMPESHEVADKITVLHIIDKQVVDNFCT